MLASTGPSAPYLTPNWYQRTPVSSVLHSRHPLRPEIVALNKIGSRPGVAQPTTSISALRATSRGTGLYPSAVGCCPLLLLNCKLVPMRWCDRRVRRWRLLVLQGPLSAVGRFFRTGFCRILGAGEAIRRDVALLRTVRTRPLPARGVRQILARASSHDPHAPSPQPDSGTACSRTTRRWPARLFKPLSRTRTADPLQVRSCCGRVPLLRLRTNFVPFGSPADHERAGDGAPQ